MLPRCWFVGVGSIPPRLSEPGLWLDSDTFYLGSLGPSGGHERFFVSKKKDEKDGKGG